MNPITIAIPYHANPGYLREALDSVARQSVLPAEVVVVDNSPEGDAGALLVDFPCPARWVRSAPGLGLAAYFNQCLDVAHTTWCTILHSDDLLLPGYVEAMTAAMGQHSGAVGIFCRTEAIGDDGGAVFSLKDWAKQYLWPDKDVEVRGEMGLAALLRANFIMCPTVCYQVALLNGRRFDGRWEVMLDLDFYGRLLLDEAMMAGVRSTLYACRRHKAATTSLYEKDFRMFLEGTRCIAALAGKASAKGWQRAEGVGRRRVIYHGYVVLRVLCNARPGNIRDSLRFARRYVQEPSVRMS